jgi:hypothetical protein
MPCPEILGGLLHGGFEFVDAICAPVCAHKRDARGHAPVDMLRRPFGKPAQEFILSPRQKNSKIAALPEGGDDF